MVLLLRESDIPQEHLGAKWRSAVRGGNQWKLLPPLPKKKKKHSIRGTMWLDTCLYCVILNSLMEEKQNINKTGLSVAIWGLLLNSSPCVECIPGRITGVWITYVTNFELLPGHCQWVAKQRELQNSKTEAYLHGCYLGEILLFLYGALQFTCSVYGWEEWLQD